MFHNLYVIDAGVCLYSYDFIEKTVIDDQLLSGFLTAIGSFAQETFQSGLQTIKILDGQKLIFYPEKTQKLTFCAIANEKDNDHLLENLLAQIAQEFVSQMAETLNSENRPALDEYKIFDGSIQNKIKNKSKPRNKKSMLTGFLTGFIISMIFTYVMSLINPTLRTILSREVFLMYFLLLLCISFSVYGGIGGYLAGNPKFGAITGLIFFIIISSLIAFDVEVFLSYLYIMPYCLIICIASGYFGGLLQDRRKLYPLIS
ncbi:MAG: hypothetical protein ACTSR8_18415 [Promethearchaeota archaeon]